MDNWQIYFSTLAQLDVSQLTCMTFEILFIQPSVLLPMLPIEVRYVFKSFDV